MKKEKKKKKETRIKKKQQTIQNMELGDNEWSKESKSK